MPEFHCRYRAKGEICRRINKEKNKSISTPYFRLAINVRFKKQFFVFFLASSLSHLSLWQEIQKLVLHF